MMARLLITLALLAGVAAAGETLIEPEDVGRALAIENLSQRADRVAGVIVNQSSQRVRDVQLQVVYSWLWADEHRQGTDDPSFVATEVVHDEIAPHGSLTFGYSYPSALTSRTDGSFIVDVRIVGFRTVTETH
jgi:hypothetical protein